jgi:hypothetical protein
MMRVHHSDKCGSDTDNECHAKGNREGNAIQQFMYRDTANAESEMCDCAGKDSNRGLREIYGSNTGE